MIERRKPPGARPLHPVNLIVGFCDHASGSFSPLFLPFKPAAVFVFDKDADLLFG